MRDKFGFLTNFYFNFGPTHLRLPSQFESNIKNIKTLVIHHNLE